MGSTFANLTHNIAQEAGLIWKIWSKNEPEQTADGIDLFNDEILIRQCLNRHTARLQSFGLTSIHSKILTVNASLSAINGFVCSFKAYTK